MPDGIAIRALRDRDIDAAVVLWREAGLLVPHNDPYEDAAFCLRSGHGTLFGAYDGPTLVGTAQVGHDGHRGWIYALAVAAGYRGQGIGQRLVEAAEAWMTARDVPKAQLIVRESNAAVRGFYERLGYAAEPRLQMGKRLRDAAPEERRGGLRTVVTHLEMPTRPARHPTPAPAGLRLAILRSEPPTLSFYRWLYDTVGGPWTWIERRLLDDEALSAIIRDPAVEIYVLYCDGTPAGYGELDRRAGNGAVELAYFGLVPEFIGRGVGRYFLDAMVDRAWTDEATRRLWVHTCDLDHPRALGAYQRAGFTVFDQTEQTLPDPRAAGLPWPSRRAPPPKAGELYLAASGDHTVVPIPLKDP